LDPCFHSENVENIQASVIVEADNIPVTEEAEEALHKKGIYCIPDFIANAGEAV
jgi:glutamate dehydrogenase (NAD(P)+)